MDLNIYKNNIEFNIIKNFLKEKKCNIFFTLNEMKKIYEIGSLYQRNGCLVEVGNTLSIASILLSFSSISNVFSIFSYENNNLINMIKNIKDINAEKIIVTIIISDIKKASLILPQQIETLVFTSSSNCLSVEENFLFYYQKTMNQGNLLIKTKSKKIHLFLHKMQKSNLISIIERIDNLYVVKKNKDISREKMDSLYLSIYNKHDNNDGKTFYEL